MISGRLISDLPSGAARLITSNTDLATMPGNVFLPSVSTGLPRDSVVNVTQLCTLNRSEFFDRVGSIIGDVRDELNDGLRRVLQL